LRIRIASQGKKVNKLEAGNRRGHRAQGMEQRVRVKKPKEDGSGKMEELEAGNREPSLWDLCGLERSRFCGRVGEINGLVDLRFHDLRFL
jgi:hypothetical protein